MIWLELDRDLTAANVIPAGKVRELHQAQPSAQVIPGVEAGHRGTVPLASISGALIFYAQDRFERYDTLNVDLLRRAKQLGERHWAASPLVERLHRGRDRSRES